MHLARPYRSPRRGSAAPAAAARGVQLLRCQAAPAHLALLLLLRQPLGSTCPAAGACETISGRVAVQPGLHRAGPAKVPKTRDHLHSLHPAMALYEGLQSGRRQSQHGDQSAGEAAGPRSACLGHAQSLWELNWEERGTIANGTVRPAWRQLAGAVFCSTQSPDSPPLGPAVEHSTWTGKSEGWRWCATRGAILRPFSLGISRSSTSCG